jgi:hypothetical protein
MKLSLVLSVGLLVYAPWASAVGILSASPDDGEPLGPRLLQAVMYAPSLPSLPRPSSRDDLLETLKSEEEEDDFPRAGSEGILSPCLVRSKVRFDGLASGPRRRDSGPLRQRPASQLRC